MCWYGERTLIAYHATHAEEKEPGAVELGYCDKRSLVWTHLE